MKALRMRLMAAPTRKDSLDAETRTTADAGTIAMGEASPAKARDAHATAYAAREMDARLSPPRPRARGTRRRAESTAAIARESYEGK